MSTDDSEADAEQNDDSGEEFEGLRTQLRALPRREAPPTFDAELHRRLTAPPSPLVQILRLHPLSAVLTALGGVVVFFSILLLPGRVGTGRPAADTADPLQPERPAATGTSPREGAVLRAAPGRPARADSAEHNRRPDTLVNVSRIHRPAAR